MKLIKRNVCFSPLCFFSDLFLSQELIPLDDKVLIENGELLIGIVCKNTVGNKQGGLIHTIFQEYGPQICAEFFANTQKLVNNWVLMNGFSVGIGDGIANPEIMIDISKIIAKSKSKNPFQ